MTDHKKPSLAFWATVGLSLPVLYILSFGPACWISSWTHVGANDVSFVYRPLIKARTPAEWYLSRYSQLAARPNWAWSKNETTNEDWHWSHFGRQ